MEEQGRRERLYRLAQEGREAQLALGLLEQCHCRQKGVLLGRLLDATTPDRAFEVACEYRALIRMLREAEASVSLGAAATKKLMEGE